MVIYNNVLANFLVRENKTIQKNHNDISKTYKPSTIKATSINLFGFLDKIIISKYITTTILIPG